MFKKYIGDKKFYKEAFLIAIPLIMQQILMSCVNLVDNLMVGQLGDIAIGGVGIANRVYSIANFSVMGFVSACTIFIAQYFGAQDEKRVKETFRLSLVGSVLFMIALSIVAYVERYPILGFFTKDVAYVESGVEYFEVAILSYIPAAITLAISFTMRTIGEIKIPLRINICAVLINCLFNYLLIFGNFGFPCLGVAGAATATFISRIVEMCLLLWALHNGNFIFKTKISELLDIEGYVVKEVLVRALPLVINEVLWSLGMSLYMKAYGHRGGEVITAYSVSGTVIDIFCSSYAGMNNATAILVGQKLGANKLELAKDYAHYMISFTLLLAIFACAIMHACAYIVPNFYDLSPASHELAYNFIRISSFTFWINMLNTEFYFIIRAGGDTRSTLIMDSGMTWCASIPAAFILSYLTPLPINSVYLGIQLSELVKLTVSTYFFKKGKWIVNLSA